jgi:hypothetical protein
MVTLSVKVIPDVGAGAGVYGVYAQITDTTAVGPPLAAGDALRGIAGYSIEVTASGGTVISSATNQSPTGSGISGFTFTRTDNVVVPGGFRALASQNTGSPGNLVLQGVGLAAGTDPFGAVWGHPVLLVSGNYVGLAGTLTATAMSNTMRVIYGPDTGWTDPARVEDAVTAPITVSAVPEPTSCLLTLLAASLAAVARRRRIFASS